MVIITDLDGTLACTEPLENLANALPVGQVLEILKHFEQNEAEIIVVTARPESAREVTEKWLNANHLNVAKIYMRSDNAPQAMFKRDCVVQIRQSYVNIYFAIDNDPSCVAMYASLGIFVLDVGINRL